DLGCAFVCWNSSCLCQSCLRISAQYVDRHCSVGECVLRNLQFGEQSRLDPSDFPAPMADLLFYAAFLFVEPGDFYALGLLLRRDRLQKRSQGVQFLGLVEAAGRGIGIRRSRSPVQDVIEAAFLITGQPGESDGPNLPLLPMPRDQVGQLCRQNGLFYGVQKGLDSRGCRFTRCKLVQVPIGNRQMPASAAQWPDDGPAGTVEHDLRADQSVRENLSDAAALVFRCITVLAQAVAQQATEQGLAPA